MEKARRGRPRKNDLIKEKLGVAEQKSSVIDEIENAITPKTRAIIAIHALGNPVDMPKLMKLVKSCNKLRDKNKIYVM